MTRRPLATRARGFLIIEVLVALLVLSLGVVGMTTLMAQVTGAAGDAKARSEALAQARTLLDELRNNALPADYEARLAAPASPAKATASSTRQVNGITYTLTSSISGDTAQPRGRRLVEVVASWTDRTGRTQSVQLESALAWNDPVRGAQTRTDLSGNVTRPSGSAQRGPARYTPGQAVELRDGASDPEKLTRLVLQSTGEVILYLVPDRNGNPVKFTTFSGRVYFDAGAVNLPASAGVQVRLSSEGQCIYDNRTANLGVAPAGASGSSVRYRYFGYTCYVGPGWYGNVGVQVPEEASRPTVCVGDPAFSDTSRTTNPAPTESALRAYRGFREATSGGVTSFITTGVASSTTTTVVYGDDGVSLVHGGAPLPSDFPSVYGSVPDSQNFLRQDFLVSRITGTQTCAQRMNLVAGTFSRNAGKSVCIKPDNTTDGTGNRCPATWPIGGTNNACAIELSGSYNPPLAATAATTTVDYTTSAGESGSCARQGSAANFNCALTGGASKTVTITGRTSGRVQGVDTTQTCVRSYANVGCNSVSGFNVDASTAVCTQTTP